MIEGVRQRERERERVIKSFPTTGLIVHRCHTETGTGSVRLCAGGSDGSSFVCVEEKRDRERDRESLRQAGRARAREGGGACALSLDCVEEERISVLLNLVWGNT